MLKISFENKFEDLKNVNYFICLKKGWYLGICKVNEFVY